MQVFEDVDWTHGAQHMWDKHQVNVEQANEALRDPERVVIEPDYASLSRRSARIIGHSDTFGDLLTIIVLRHKETGVEYGVNGWPANSTDRRYYREGWTP